MALSPDYDPGMRTPTVSEIKQSLPASGVIFDQNAIYKRQAESMGGFTGVPITPEQRDLYAVLRSDSKQTSSDQSLLREVLKKTGGPVDQFERAYPNIFQ